MVPLLWIYTPGYYVTFWIAEHIMAPLAARDPVMFSIGFFGLIALIVVLVKE